MSEINKLDAFSAVEELTDAAAAVVGGGGGSFPGRVNFDSFVSTRSFFVPRGGSIGFASTTVSAPSNRLFTAVLRNLSTGRTSSEIVAVGRGVASWANVRGGTYRIDLVDRRDGIRVSGTIGVSHS